MNKSTAKKSKRFQLTKKQLLNIILVVFISLIIILAFSIIVGYPIWTEGKIQHLNLEGGMFEFEDADGNIYDLYGVKDVLSDQEYQMLINNTDTQYKAKLSGWVLPVGTVTIHMHGTPVEVWTLEIDE
jgi:hypothetical protein